MRAAALLCVLLASVAARADEDTISGSAKVRGPDMLVLSGTRVRLSGVLPPTGDASCDGTPCAELAAAALGELTGGGPVACVKERRLGHGYFLGHCKTADGADPALKLLERGLLQPDPAGAPESYQHAADVAKSVGAGLWGG
ncbi:MAG: hypothetical protein U1E52_06940 [Geminicoccaceae bacterium]